MARLLRYIHPHVSRYAQVDVPCRQTIIRRNRVELFLTVTLNRFMIFCRAAHPHHLRDERGPSAGGPGAVSPPGDRIDRLLIGVTLSLWLDQ